MSTTENKDNNTEPAKLGGRQSGSLVLIGFCVAVLVLFAVILNNPAKVVEWSARLLRRPSPRHECMRNMMQIDEAVMQWALENRKISTSTYSLTDPNIICRLRGSVLPLCPLGGRYFAGTNVCDSPHCTIPGHTL